MAEYNIKAEFIPVNFNLPPVLTTKTITTNGVYNAADDGATGYSSVTVVVPDRKPLIQPLNVTPSVSAQTIEVTQGIDGYGPVNVSGVSNVLPENIRQGASILGVTGTYIKPQGYIPRKLAYNTISTNTTDLMDFSGIKIVEVHALEYACYNNTNYTSVDLSGLTDIYEYGCRGAFYNCTNLTSVKLSGRIKGERACSNMFRGCVNLVNVDLAGLVEGTSYTGTYPHYCFENMFADCTSLVTVDLSSLTTLIAQYGAYYMFYRCTSLKSVNLCNLWRARGLVQMFNGCTSLESVDISSWRIFEPDASGANNMFAGCTKLESISFTSLKGVPRYSNEPLKYTFAGCTALKHVYFPALQAGELANNVAFFGMLWSNLDGCTVHFPKNFDPQTGSTVISSKSGYPNFSGINTILAFDQPSSFVLTGEDNKNYVRNPKYDGANSLCWCIGDTISVQYYTSTLNDPQVGDTIYSDSGCTQAVTTIDHLADQ